MYYRDVGAKKLENNLTGWSGSSNFCFTKIKKLALPKRMFTFKLKWIGC
jgi:hypothetical protein